LYCVDAAEIGGVFSDECDLAFNRRNILLDCINFVNSRHFPVQLEGENH